MGGKVSENDYSLRAKVVSSIACSLRGVILLADSKYGRSLNRPILYMVEESIDPLLTA